VFSRIVFFWVRPDHTFRFGCISARSFLDARTLSAVAPSTVSQGTVSLFRFDWLSDRSNIGFFLFRCARCGDLSTPYFYGVGGFAESAFYLVGELDIIYVVFLTAQCVSVGFASFWSRLNFAQLCTVTRFRKSIGLQSGCYLVFYLSFILVD